MPVLQEFFIGFPIVLPGFFCFCGLLLQLFFAACDQGSQLTDLLQLFLLLLLHAFFLLSQFFHHLVQFHILPVFLLGLLESGKLFFGCFTLPGGFLIRLVGVEVIGSEKCSCISQPVFLRCDLFFLGKKFLFLRFCVLRFPLRADAV